MIDGRRLPPRHFTPAHRRRGGAAFRLAALPACGRDLRVRPSRAARPAPALCSRAKACSALVDPRAAAAAGARRDALARLIERRDGGSDGSAALGGAHRARSHLCQARPIPGDAARRRRHGDRARPRKPAGQDGAVPAGEARSRPSRAAFDRKLSDLFVSFRSAGRRRLDRAGASRRNRDGGGRRAVAVKVLRPGVERRFAADLAAFRFAARNAEALSAEARRLRLDRSGRHARPLGRDRDGFSARGRGALGDGGEHQGRRRFPRAGGRLGRSPRATCSRSNGSTARRSTTAPRSSPRGSTCRGSAAR